MVADAVKTVVSNQDAQMTILRKINTQAKTNVNIKAPKSIKGFKVQAGDSDEEDA